VLCNIVGAATVYKIVKKDYIALQCKSLKLKEELNRDRVDNKGTQSVPESRLYFYGVSRRLDCIESSQYRPPVESAHTKWTMSQGCGDLSSLWSPAPEGR
jgi:hypothetical protein